MVVEIAGRPEPRLVTLAGSLFLYIAGANLGPPARRPSADREPRRHLGARRRWSSRRCRWRGSRRAASAAISHTTCGRDPLLLPLHLVAEVSRTVALSVRLFGNMMSGQLVVALLVALTGFLVPMPLMALDLLIGLLQAYIFTVLATVYVGAAIRAAEE